VSGLTFEHFKKRNVRRSDLTPCARDVLMARPGSRLLVVVGASHKAYFDAYLHQMHDLRLADVAALLR
jgi:hypothetical protein